MSMSSSFARNETYLNQREPTSSLGILYSSTTKMTSLQTLQHQGCADFFSALAPKLRIEILDRTPLQDLRHLISASPALLSVFQRHRSSLLGHHVQDLLKFYVDKSLLPFAAITMDLRAIRAEYKDLTVSELEEKLKPALDSVISQEYPKQPTENYPALAVLEMAQNLVPELCRAFDTWSGEFCQQAFAGRRPVASQVHIYRGLSETWLLLQYILLSNRIPFQHFELCKETFYKTISLPPSGSSWEISLDLHVYYAQKISRSDNPTWWLSSIPAAKTRRGAWNLDTGRVSSTSKGIPTQGWDTTTLLCHSSSHGRISSLRQVAESHGRGVWTLHTWGILSSCYSRAKGRGVDDSMDWK